MRRWPESGTFGAVMSMGILSVALGLLGYGAASRILLVLACLAYAGIAASVLTAGRALWGRLAADVADPRAAFGHFTFPAASDVLASRLALAHATVPAAVLLGVGAAAWIVLIIAVARQVGAWGFAHWAPTGSAFLAVVATESVPVATAAVLGADPSFWFPAATLWGIGLLLYVLILALLIIRLPSSGRGADGLDPSFGLTMGALAISTLAALLLHRAAQAGTLAAVARPVLSVAVVTWSAGGIFMLLLCAVWCARAIRQGVRPSYRVSEWSIVFPLGMYGTAGILLARATLCQIPRLIASLSVAASLLGLLAVSLLALLPSARSRLGIEGGHPPDPHQHP